MTSIQEKNNIIESYINGTSPRELAKQYNFKCHKSIIKILRENNIKIRTSAESNQKLFSAKQIKSILKKYSKIKTTLNELAKLYNSDSKTIKKLLIKEKVYDPLKYTNYLIDKFKQIDNQDKAYWLGFLAADASISEKQLSLRLAGRDHSHVLKFKKFIGINYKVSKTKSILNNKTYYGSEYRISNKEFVKSLLLHNLSSSKSFNLSLPTTIPNNLMNHYIRGLIDGDGCFSVSKNKMYFNLISSINMCELIQEILIKNCNLNKTKIHIHKCINGNMAYIKYCGNKQVLRIASYLYNDATISLNRKRKLIFNYFENFSKPKTL